MNNVERQGTNEKGAIKEAVVRTVCLVMKKGVRNAGYRLLGTAVNCYLNCINCD